MRGPEPIQRRSLAIFTSETATVRMAPENSTRESWAAWASKWLSASTQRQPSVLGNQLNHARAKPGRGVDARADGGAPKGSSARRGRAASTRSMPLDTWAA